MKALLQRVSMAHVTAGQETLGRIGGGILVFLGIGMGDGPVQARELAEKIVHLRIFEGLDGRFDLSLLDVKGEALVVSQFTLYADCRKGRRPSFSQAAPPETARELYQVFLEELAAKGVKVESGRFGEHMEVSLVNDGPVTLMLEVRPPDGC
ncbi:MAG: D-aminoacyl-tRNA deacylase [Thermodesulfobacteriota bacterium]